MIIFDLDGTIADCEHRRHFVDPSKRNDTVLYMKNTTVEKWIYFDGWDNELTRRNFVPDWQAFFEACDKDEPIKPVIDIFYTMQDVYRLNNIQIWSGRCESVREKTIEWLLKHAHYDEDIILKMRPIGNREPDEVLKERWLDEYISSLYPPLEKDMPEGTILKRKNPIAFVFDDRKKVCNMWRRRGIFVFDVNQTGEEF